MFEEEEDIESTLTFYVKKDGSTHIDIGLANYNQDTISNFAKLICRLSNPQLQLEAVGMTKEGLLADGNEKVCELFLPEVAKYSVKNKLRDIKEERKEDGEPCIKPSDML